MLHEEVGTHSKQGLRKEKNLFVASIQGVLFDALACEEPHRRTFYSVTHKLVYRLWW